MCARSLVFCFRAWLDRVHHRVWWNRLDLLKPIAKRLAARYSNEKFQSCFGSCCCFRLRIRDGCSLFSLPPPPTKREAESIIAKHTTTPHDEAEWGKRLFSTASFCCIFQIFTSMQKLGPRLMCIPGNCFMFGSALRLCQNQSKTLLPIMYCACGVHIVYLI